MATTEVIFEGFMFKRGHLMKTWKQRWFVLTPTKLKYFETRPENPDQESAVLKSFEIQATSTVRSIPQDTHNKLYVIEIRTGRKDLFV